jgi:hypothetical protein
MPSVSSRSGASAPFVHERRSGFKISQRPFSTGGMMGDEWMHMLRAKFNSGRISRLDYQHLLAVHEQAREAQRRTRAREGAVPNTVGGTVAGTKSGGKFVLSDKITSFFRGGGAFRGLVASRARTIAGTQRSRSGSMPQRDSAADTTPNYQSAAAASVRRSGNVGSAETATGLPITIPQRLPSRPYGALAGCRLSASLPSLGAPIETDLVEGFPVGARFIQTGPHGNGSGRNPYHALAIANASGVSARPTSSPEDLQAAELLPEESIAASAKQTEVERGLSQTWPPARRFWDRAQTFTGLFSDRSNPTTVPPTRDNSGNSLKFRRLHLQQK